GTRKTNFYLTASFKFSPEILSNECRVFIWHSILSSSNQKTIRLMIFSVKSVSFSLDLPPHQF
ncbi:hypothetical protein KJ761_02830, partial [Patescibacteria group bacterium]|nr:hypothetical protein [Patescibacteria group bacterium]